MEKIKNIVGWTATILVSLLMLISVFVKIFVVGANPEITEMFKNGGIYEIRYYLATASLIIPIIFLMPRTMTLGFVLAVGYWGGATATVITHGDYQELRIHVAVLFLLGIASWFRHPEIWARFLNKPFGKA
ncbi:MAG: hypothetical protein Q8O32_01240 [bacterium]|nr:hypothetical protein [bacterium]